MDPYSATWGRGGPLDQTPAPGPTPYQSYVDQYRALNDAWYDAWLNPVPLPVPEAPAPKPPAAAPQTPYTDPAPRPTASTEGRGGGLDYGRGPSGVGGGSLAGMFSGPTGALFGSETFADLEPGMVGLGGVSLGTGITENLPGHYGDIHDVAVFDAGALAGGLLGGLAGPLGSTVGGYLGGLATPEVALGSTGRIGSVIDVLSDPSSYSNTAVQMAMDRFGQAPTLDLSGGPMGGGGRGMGGFGGGRGGRAPGYGDPGGPRGGEYSGRGTGGLY